MLVLLRIFFFIIFLSFQQVYAGGSPGTPGQSTYRVAVVQLDSSYAGNFVEMAKLAKEAKGKGAELVVFPESSVFGWLNPKVFTEVAPIPGMSTSQFAAIATDANIWVAAGLAERGPEAGSDSGFYQAYDSGILVNPKGEIVLHHRKYNVLKNSFNPSECPSVFGTDGCSYTAGSLSDIKTAQTPFGRTAILVCADAYTYDKTVLEALKAYKPQFVIVPWGVAAGAQDECGKANFNATDYASEAAKFLETAYVVGANAVGQRPYGRFLPSWYCGTSGFATPSGQIGGVADTTQTMALFDIPLPTATQD